MTEIKTASPDILNLLLAGPWIGDFGFEICAWVPYVRKLARVYGKTVVVCEPGHEYLYRDFCDEFWNYTKDGWRDRWTVVGKEPKIPGYIREKYPGARILVPNEKRIWRGWVKGEFRKYGNKNGNGYDILIHARNLKPNSWYDKKVVKGSRNWPADKWIALVEHFKDYRIAYIGSQTGSRCFGNGEDLRGLALDKLCSIMVNSKVIVGESSGPLHLASHCGCPQVVITHDHKEKSLYGKTNRDRYKTLWNPFHTPCKVLDRWEWCPPVDRVVKAVKKFV